MIVTLYRNNLFHREPRKKDFIEFVPTKRRVCYSFIGRDGGRQNIVLFEGCAEEQTLIHEVSLAYR